MDNTKPEAQQKPLSETEISPDSTSARQQTDIPSDAYPAALQTKRLSDTPSRSQTSSPQPRRPEAETLSAETSANFASRHERMPSVNSLPPKEGHFGVVSSSGQLVCTFLRPTPGADEQGHEAPSAESVSPPPQIISNRPGEAAPLSSSPSNGQTASTLELAVDYDSYPEVYVPEEEEEPSPGLPPRNTNSPPIPRKSLPMDDPAPAPAPASAPAPAYSTPADYQSIGYSGTLDMSTAVPTVTPLHMLGDQPDTVDCPFCMRRVETSVKKAASKMTHTWGTILFFTTLFGVVAPYCCDWYVNVEHYCKNCNRKVAQKKFDSNEVEVLGTRPEHRQVSYFEPAEKPAEKKFRS